MIKNEVCFGRLINRLNMSKERFSDLKDMAKETFQTEKQKKKKNGTLRNVEHTHG